MDAELVGLVGAHEIREMLGVSRQRIYQLAGRPGFPKPIATLAQGKIWARKDIEAWIDLHRAGGQSVRRRSQTPAVAALDRVPLSEEAPRHPVRSR